MITWMLRSHLPQLIAIDALTFDNALDAGGFCDMLRQRKSIGMVYKRDDLVVGFMIYLMHKEHIDLVRLAVHPDYRRQGIGRGMIEALKRKIMPRRRRLQVDVCERNVDAQRFLTACGLRVLNVVRGACGSDDAYRFCWAVTEVRIEDLAWADQVFGCGG